MGLSHDHFGPLWLQNKQNAVAIHHVFEEGYIRGPVSHLIAGVLGQAQTA